jgi:hypothetical protein
VSLLDLRGSDSSLGYSSGSELIPVPGILQVWSSACGLAVVAVGREWLGFLSRRMREDFALSQHLTATRDFDQFWQIYADFWQKALRD